jgi:hypothetical protein
LERRGQGAGGRRDREQRRLGFGRGAATRIVAAAIVWLAAQVREAQAVISKDNEVRFVPAVVDAAPPVGSGHLRRKARRQHRDEPLVGTIEVAIDGATVRIGAGAPADTIAAVLRALKACA